jgi:hypothetical protein
MPLEKWISAANGNGQKSPSSKAAALLARGAYSQYVSTAKGDLPARSVSAEAGNAADGFFQHSRVGRTSKRSLVVDEFWNFCLTSSLLASK